MPEFPINHRHQENKNEEKLFFFPEIMELKQNYRKAKLDIANVASYDSV